MNVTRVTMKCCPNFKIIPLPKLYKATLITAHDHRFVIPAKAGIHTNTLDSHFRGNDNTFE